MGSKVLGPIGAVLGIGMAVKNMNDIIEATRKGEADDPSHVRGQGINVNTGDVVTRLDSQASRCGSPSRGSSSALGTRLCLARRSRVRWAVPATAAQRRAKGAGLTGGAGCSHCAAVHPCCGESNAVSSPVVDSDP
jgi:hypothetical protein